MIIQKRENVSGILAKFLEKALKILLKKECKKISQIKINIFASSLQVLKGIIQKINISAKAIDYKELLFDEIELEANDLKIRFKINNKELCFKNNTKIKFKISLSEKSLTSILSSSNWAWIGNIICKGILGQDELQYIKIKNDQLLIKPKIDNKTLYNEEQVVLKSENGKLYLKNINYTKCIEIPIENKVHIDNVFIKNNLIFVFASSSISFN